MQKSIIIIGGGFCGTLAAVHLLRTKTDHRYRIVLIERSETLARGVAYSTEQPAHRLNVPAARMSALPEDENHFLNFVRKISPHFDAGDFAPRHLYGDYLQDLLTASIAAATDRHEFRVINGAATNIENTATGVRIVLSSGESIEAEWAILAFGNVGPRHPAIAAESRAFSSPRYIENPWANGALERVDKGRPVLLIGTGLTAVDIAISLRESGFAQPMHALSRHGLVPIAHRDSHHPLQLELPPLVYAPTLQLRQLLRVLRRYATELGQAGIDWRDVMVALRPLTAALWRKLNGAERARFLRHAQAYWEVFRHRLAPEIASRLQVLLQARALTIHAGRIVSIGGSDTGLGVIFRPRGERDLHSLQVGTVINCTGMNGNVSRSDDPLLQALHTRGVLRADAHRLGVVTDNRYALVDVNGIASDRLFYVGPLLKARFWEATAVPELRLHVQKLIENFE